MKKAFLIVIIFGLALGGLFSQHSRFSESPDIRNEENITSQNYVSEVKETENSVIKYDKPVEISIPSINIDSVKIEEVGLTQDRNMDVPKSYETVGWYNRGPVPGELGSSVLAGHLDSPSGKAVFWNLEKLQSGDIIQTEDFNGNTAQFKVIDKQVYEVDNFPVEKIFGQKDKKRLNLITCEGIFDKSSKIYSHRTVIFSKMVE